MSISKIKNSIISKNLLSRGFTELSDIQNKILDIYQNQIIIQTLKEKNEEEKEKIKEIDFFCFIYLSILKNRFSKNTNENVS